MTEIPLNVKKKILFLFEYIRLNEQRNTLFCPKNTTILTIDILQFMEGVPLSYNKSTLDVEGKTSILQEKYSILRKRYH